MDPRSEIETWSSVRDGERPEVRRGGEVTLPHSVSTLFRVPEEDGTGSPFPHYQGGSHTGTRGTRGRPLSRHDSHP